MNGIEIKYENNQMIVSSMEVAKNFNKNHKELLRTIRSLLGGVRKIAQAYSMNLVTLTTKTNKNTLCIT